METAGSEAGRRVGTRRNALTVVEGDVPLTSVLRKSLLISPAKESL